MKFRPCIDLHHGVVKHIVGSTLGEDIAAVLETNFQSAKPASHYAELYRSDGLTGGHVNKLGPNNETAAISALSAWPEGLKIGGGIRGASGDSRRW